MDACHAVERVRSAAATQTQRQRNKQDKLGDGSRHGYWRLSFSPGRPEPLLLGAALDAYGALGGQGRKRARLSRVG